ncbi:hypothetical protein PLANPX_3801 [Lacipirellula parvula]|uniref:DUF932 domain-containing protein n=1 Tax=Lacipirellula parvula TaxID=2650471 RepID=A0A5K7XMD7_9BACT|nr:hypothetical protein PLANPX_3801 [Lacipirellula parvula]
MEKQNLTRASQELFRRSPDESFESLGALSTYCSAKREQSVDVWHPPSQITPELVGEDFGVRLGSDGAFLLNDWSFSQLCKCAAVGKETINRLSPHTAASALKETLPRSNKPLQFYHRDQVIRSIHGTGYTRLHDSDVVAMLQEFAVDFQPPQVGMNGATGLYAGEQDLFCFLIDPQGWTEIEGEAFAPGFFIWNSEVGKRSIGIETFWFQAVCQNHIVWDATEVVEFTRKHTSSVHSALTEMKRIIEALVAKRDERRAGFIEVIGRAMRTKLGDDADEVLKTLTKNGIGRSVAKQAMAIAEQQGRFTIFALVDALTRMSGEIVNAGDRTDADERAGALLALAQ